VLSRFCGCFGTICLRFRKDILVEAYKLQIATSYFVVRVVIDQ
jgi:hypothetical protein